MKKILFLLIIVASSCSSIENNKNADDKFNLFLKDSFKDKTGILFLKNYNAFSWDKVYIIPPYSNQDVLDSNLLKYKTNVSKTGIETRDDITVLFFFNKDKLISQNVVSVKIDFADINKFSDNKLFYYKKENAEFKYVKNKDGTITLNNL